MKSRSNNRLPTSDPPDDWVNGSWTVDCICGVTFDDGEEMVNCDECGVWVHTRCFRFVKGEKSFACDKCKRKGSNRISNDDSEETEVAQLLVELPTKTIKMSTSNNNGSYYCNSGSNRNSSSNVFAYNNHPPPPPRRIWAKPMEERVHVQGVPGGGDDPNLFKGFSIPFASELWRCSGCVPKKFNFRYREFPCWDDELKVEVEAKADVGSENAVDKGAGVLYSLSKENVVVNVRGGQERSGGSERKGLKDRKSSNGDLKKSNVVSFSKKEKGMCRSIVLKRSREELRSPKDSSRKKKIKVSPREQDSKKEGHDYESVVVHSISARQAEVGESKTHKVALKSHPGEGNRAEKTKTNAATDEGNLVSRSLEVSRPAGSREKDVAEKPARDGVDSSQKSDSIDFVALLNVEKDGVAKDSSKKVGIVVSETMDNSQALISVCQNSDVVKSKAISEDVNVTAIERNDAEVVKDVETTGPVASKTSSDVKIDNPKGGMRSHPDDIDVKLHSDGMKHYAERGSSSDQECAESKPNDTVADASHEDQDDVKSLEALTGSQLVKDEGITENECDINVKSESSENPADVRRTSLDSKESARVAGETPKLNGEILPPLASSIHKVSVGKSSPSSSTIVNSRFSLSDKNKSGSSHYSSSTGKRMLSNSSMVTIKESDGHVQVKDEDKYEKTKSIVRDHLKSSSTIKASQSRTVTSSVLKHHTSLAKDSMRHSSSKKTSVELSCANDEPIGSQPTQQGSNGHNKTTSTGQHRGEKAPQSNFQSSSKSAQFGHPPPSSIAPAGLSDEELAKLLHQELNSSPRVPRVPRVRHTGSLPQLFSASATSILIKRSTSSGRKEQQTFSRRKHKDGSRNCCDQDGEARKLDRAPSSPDSVKTSDAVAQTEEPSESIHSVRKNSEDISTSTHSGPSSTDANELKSSSFIGSPNNNPEDDTGTNKGPAHPIHRTLPGLIAEIMGEGRRMTYEELCNAVRPHWPNLRKHNGERYAYSSHSQAVLDCLRNRSEWARLVDRGPKTNAGRKKRKIDVEPSNTESDDGEYRTRRGGKSKSFESSKEEFPKGRRKARKRRRLALRGRGVRDDRKRTKVEVRSEDSASFSDSSEDTGSSEDDSQESGMCVSKSEVSASSAETAAAH